LGSELRCLQEGPFRASYPNLGHSVSSGIDTKPSILRYFTSASKRTYDPDLPVPAVLHFKKPGSGQLASSTRRIIIKGPNNVNIWRLRCASVATLDNAIHNVDPGQLVSITYITFKDPDDFNIWKRRRTSVTTFERIIEISDHQAYPLTHGLEGILCSSISSTVCST
jgi:hypothetical protein